MANQTVPNYALASANELTSGIWKLTRAMKAAGWVYKASSNGTIMDTGGVATNDKWGGAATPLTDVYPTLAAGSWWCAQGPSMLKIPIGATVPSGSGFTRGEAITQAVSSATGEVVGVVTDTATSLGYLVVAPRTGTFNGTDLITGSSSGSTVTPSTTVIEYQQFVVFWRSDATQGHIYHQCVDPVGEASSLFTSAARLAAVTTTMCPGGASSGANVFPTIGTYAAIGTGGSNAVSSGPKVWTCTTPTPVTYGVAQILCANATPSAGVSADGSFTFAVGTPAISAGTFVGIAFHRCDDTEDGDVNPYVWFVPNYVTLYTGTRTVNTQVISVTTRNASSDFFCAGTIVCAVNYNFGSGMTYRGWRNRGLPTGDAFQEYIGCSLIAEDWYSSQFFRPLEQNPGTPESVASNPAVFRVREPVWVLSYQNAQKQRKGTLRWWYLVQGGNGCDTYDSHQWIQLSGSARSPVIAGPWDGVTTPANS